MIVIYNTSSLVITQIAGGTDSSVYSYMAARVGAGEDIFSVTDDIAVMNSPAAYVVVPPTGTERTKSISVIPSVNPIELNATPTLTIQLLDKNLNPDAVSGITVILRATNGIVTPPSFVTNAGGNNTETITYHPNKTFGTIDIVAEESPTGLYYPGFLTMTINGPDTAAEQSGLSQSVPRADALHFHSRSL